jgi:hypothetical protein
MPSILFSVYEGYFLELNQLKHDIDHLLTLGAEAKNE